MRLFVTGTGTGVGKTVVACALARALRAAGRDIVALKPIETGCDPDPRDALALALACGDQGAAHDPGFYRARPPLAPHAAALAGATPVDYAAVLDATRAYFDRAHVIVEGAGGLLVPIDASRTMAELAGDLDAPLLLVAVNALGVLSHTLTAIESARARGLEIRSIVICDAEQNDSSSATNIDILRARVDAPVHRFPRVETEAENVRAGAALLGRLPLSRTRRAP